MLSSRLTCIALAISLVGCGARTGLDAIGPFAIPEACNGEDDDSDGIVDEDVPPLPCGVGACRNEEPGCPVDRPPSCEPLAAHDESCNAIDDDCDGAIDESLGFGLVAGPFEVASEATGYFTADLVSSGGGLVAVWNVGFDGSHPPVTNAFSRQLDADGHAIGERTPILSRPTTTGVSASASPRGIVLTYCGRFGFEDVTASAFLDATGAPIGGPGGTEVRRGDGMRSCGAVPQSGIDTGARYLFSWITNGGGLAGVYDVFLDVADERGVALSGTTVEPLGDLYSRPSFATRGDVVALTYALRPTLRETAIDLLPLGRDGAALGPATRLGREAVEVHGYGSATVVESAEGFLVVTADPNGPGLYRARTGPTGELLAPLELVETSGRRFDQLDVVAAPGGPAFLVANAYSGPDSSVVVARLDADGRPSSVWDSGPTLPYVLVPALATEGARVFLLSGAIDGRTLEIRELGCTP